MEDDKLLENHNNICVKINNSIKEIYVKPVKSKKYLKIKSYEGTIKPVFIMIKFPAKVFIVLDFQ